MHIVLFGVMGQRLIFFWWGRYPQMERGKFLFRGRGGIGQCNVGLTYRKNVVLRCGCSVAMAE